MTRRNGKDSEFNILKMAEMMLIQRDTNFQHFIYPNANYPLKDQELSKISEEKKGFQVSNPFLPFSEVTPEINRYYLDHLTRKFIYLELEQFQEKDSWQSIKDKVENFFRLTMLFQYAMPVKKFAEICKHSYDPQNIFKGKDYTVLSIIKGYVFTGIKANGKREYFRITDKGDFVSLQNSKTISLDSFNSIMMAHHFEIGYKQENPEVKYPESIKLLDFGQSLNLVHTSMVYKHDRLSPSKELSVTFESNNRKETLFSTLELIIDTNMQHGGDSTNTILLKGLNIEKRDFANFAEYFLELCALTNSESTDLRTSAYHRLYTYELTQDENYVSGSIIYPHIDFSISLDEQNNIAFYYTNFDYKHVNTQLDFSSNYIDLPYKIEINLLASIVLEAYKKLKKI